MQPRPMAETKGPCEPNLRVFMVVSSEILDRSSADRSQLAIDFRLGQDRVGNTNALFNHFVIGDLVRQKRVGPLQFYDLFGNAGLMVLKDLAPLEGRGIAQFAQLGITLHFANRHARCPHAMKKVKPRLVGLGITPVTVARASYRLDQPHALIVAKRVRGHSAPLCHASYGVSRVLHTITVQLEARSKSRTPQAAKALKIAPAAKSKLAGVKDKFVTVASSERCLFDRESATKICLTILKNQKGPK